VQSLIQNRLPIDATDARNLGLIDECFAVNSEEFANKIRQTAESLAKRPDFSALLQQKTHQRELDERLKPLQSYRDEELRQMQLNFYGFDPSYHVARYHFVHKIPHSWTPRYLAKHRRL
jgi:putative two-component system hydrogenase maturation factor HypX/HoxX